MSVRRVLALAAACAAGVAPASAQAGTAAQDVAVAQAGLAAANAVSQVSVSGGACFAGCPTVVVSPVTAVAVTVDLAVVTQLLNQLGTRP